MGNSPIGQTKISYRTKDKLQIEYFYYDLKGKNRFPPIPYHEKQIELMFEKCLREIDTTTEQMELIRDFNSKYKFRFVIIHGRKIQEHREKNELSKLRKTQHLGEDQFKSIQDKRKKDLQEKLRLLETNQKAIKMNLGAIDRYISEKNASTQFIKIDGIKRLITILEKAISSNKQGTKTIFQSQIEILKFLKSFSDHYSKEYLKVVDSIPKYASILLKGYHPVNVAVTAYILALLQDYAWKGEKSIIEALELMRQEDNLNSYLDPFVQTIYETDNILMCFYNLHFINEMLVSRVDDDEKRSFKNELRIQKFDLLIEDIKSKLQDNYFKIQYCSFIYVNQKIYKFATQNKKNTKENLQQAFKNRGTMDLDILHQYLIVNLIDDFNNQNNIEKLTEDDDDSCILVYLDETDRKNFNRFIFDTFSEIQHYYKYSIIIDEFGEEMDNDQVPQVQMMKKYGLSLEEYIKRIKGICLNNGCEGVMLNCFKTMQYFEKLEWKKLETFLVHQINTQKLGNDKEYYQKTLEEREKEIKVLKKQIFNLKTEMIGNSKIQQPKNVNISKLDMTLVELSHNNKGAIETNVLDNGLNIQDNLNRLPLPNANHLPKPPQQIQNTKSDCLPNLTPQSKVHQIYPLPQNNLIHSMMQTNSNILPPLPPNNLNKTPNILPPLPPPPNGLINANQLILPGPLPIIGLPPIGIPSLPPSLPGFPSLSGFPSLPGLPGIDSMPLQKQKQKKKPKIPLKNCNYNVLSYDKIVNTIWENVDDINFKLDQTELEDLFRKAQPKQQILNKDLSTASLTSVKKKEPIKLIGSDRWRNMEIILTKLKMPEGAISEALTTCSGKYATQAIFQSLIKILPTQQEHLNIRSFEGQPEELGKPEKFLRELISVPEYSSRVKALLFINYKDQMYFELQNNIENLIIAFDSLKANYRFHYVLEAALAIGNYLNGTGLKGGAWGFRLDTLERMEEVKSSDNKMNAGFYVVKEVWKKYTYPIFDKEQVEMYQFISKMPTSQIKADLAEIKKYSTSIEKAFNSKVKNNPNDRIDQSCQEILMEIKEKQVIFEESVKKMENAFTQCATFYCEDPIKGTSDEIGKRIFKSILFIFNTEKVFYEIEEKRKKQEARKAPKSQITFHQSPINVKKINNFTNVNPESGSKLPKLLDEALNLPLPPQSPFKMNVVEMNAEDRLKQLQKTQQTREKKFLEQIMKKRTSKMVAFRQSKNPGFQGMKRNQQPEIDFLKNL